MTQSMVTPESDFSWVELHNSLVNWLPQLQLLLTSPPACEAWGWCTCLRRYKCDGAYRCLKHTEWPAAFAIELQTVMLKICSERNTIGQEAESAALNNGVHNRRVACTHPSLSSLREVPKFVGGKKKENKSHKAWPPLFLTLIPLFPISPLGKTNTANSFGLKYIPCLGTLRCLNASTWPWGLTPVSRRKTGGSAVGWRLTGSGDHVTAQCSTCPCPSTHFCKHHQAAHWFFFQNEALLLISVVRPAFYRHLWAADSAVSDL